MPLPSRDRLRNMLLAEWRQLTAFQSSDRLWQMPLAAALASGAPLMIGAWAGRVDYGLISSLGGIVFLYVQDTPLSHRMVTLMTCAFGLAASYALGVISHFFPLIMVAALTFIAILATMIVRLFRLPPPGSIFFIMAASIGMYTPGVPLEIPLKVGLLTMGALLACLIAFFYSLYALRLRPARPVEPLPPPSFDFVVYDSILIGMFVGASMALAQALQVERAYWAPVSCAAVIQGASLRAVWNRQVHRIAGTCVGLMLAWALLLLPLDAWGVSFVMMALAFATESLVVRHYGLAAVFITPMAIFLAEAASLGHGSPTILIAARFLDTVLGCGVGLIGGACIHNARVRDVLGGYMRRLAPARASRPHL